MLVPASRVLRRLTLALFLLPVLSAPVSAEGTGGVERSARLKELQVRFMQRGAKRKLARYTNYVKSKAKPQPGHGRKPAVPEPDPPGLAPLTTARGPMPASVAAIATNRLVNNRAGDGAPGSGQCEVSIAAHGLNVVAAWNDGEGFFTGLSTQGFGYSIDGGVTWVDGGIPPTTNVGLWTSDPVITVNEKTGEFYFAALCEPTVSSNGIGVVKGTFSGGALVWGTPELAISGSYSQVIYDKEWIAADSLSGNVYLIYSRFTVNGGNLTTNRIDFQRKLGVAAFTAPVTLSSVTDAFRVQGSRVAVGPAGEVWVTWNAIGAGIGGGEPTDEDHMRVRRSTTQGLTFGPEITAVNQYTNFGSGAPGFNRGTGFAFPGLAVDRSTGIHRGRAFLIWNESVNFYPDVIGAGGTTAEVEPNDTPNQGTLFTMGRRLTGTISSFNPADFDYFQFNGLAGQTIICEANAGPLPNPTLNAAFRLFCNDGLTRLAFSETGVGDRGLIVFTLPLNATYTLRVGPIAGTGQYVIDTGLNGPVTERGRDHRDVFTSFSDNLTTWSAPARVNGDPALFDNWLPEIAVSADGKVFASWYDWRDAPGANCFGASMIYLSGSGNGGASWPDGSPVTSAFTSWTTAPSNIAPNQGDYTGLYANQNGVYVCWSDGRNGDPDVFVAVPSLTFTPVQVSVASTHVEPGLVRVVWYAADATAFPATAYRRTGDGDWTSLGLLSRDGNGQLILEDRDVQPGGRYHYRLGVREGAEEVFLGEVAVDVPAGSTLRIEEIRPNPSDRELWVSFTLAGNAPATLELIDVSGRRVREKAVEGSGRQTVELAAGSRLPPGLYIVRLTQNGQSVVKRASVVR